MYLKSNYFISAFQSCLSIQANSHLINSPHFYQQYYQLTKPIFKFINPVSNPPLLDIFPQSKNPWLSFRFKTGPQTTESLYLLILLHSYLSTLDINTTVSTWLERIEWMSFDYVRSRKHIYCVFYTIGRRKHIHRLRCFLKNWGMLLIFSTQYCK